VSERSLWYDGTRHVQQIRNLDSARHFRIEFESGLLIRIESRIFAGPYLFPLSAAKSTCLWTMKHVENLSGSYF